MVSIATPIDGASQDDDDLASLLCRSVGHRFPQLCLTGMCPSDLYALIVPSLLNPLRQCLYVCLILVHQQDHQRLILAVSEPHMSVSQVPLPTHSHTCSPSG